MRVDRMDKLIRRFWPDAKWERVPGDGDWASIRLPRYQDGAVFRLTFRCLSGTTLTHIAIGDGTGHTRRFEYIQDALAELLHLDRHLYDVEHPSGILSVVATIRRVGHTLEPEGAVAILQKSPDGTGWEMVQGKGSIATNADLAMILAFIADETAWAPLVDWAMGVEG